MRLQPLQTIPYATLHRTFRDAFADYAVPFDISLEQFQEIHRRRGVRLDLSVGAFEGDQLVGFTFNGFGTWDGAPAGYDAGTGVVSSARGRGLASRMMDESLALLRTEGATRYVLEVLQSNPSAFRIYERAGFRTTRELYAWKLDAVSSTKTSTVAITEGELDSLPMPDMWDWQPSWQNSLDSMRRAAETRTILAARHDHRIVGYAVVFASGDLAQFGVTKARRREGIGTALVRAARDACGKPLRIINTDAGDRGTTAFLGSLGARELVRQYEMVRDI